MSFFNKKTKNQTDSGDFTALSEIVQDDTVELGLPLNDNTGKKSNMSKVGLAAGAMVAVALIVFGLIAATSGKEETETAANQPPTVVTNTRPNDFEADKQKMAQQLELDLPETAAEPTETETPIPPAHSQNETENTQNTPPPEDLNQARRLSGEVVLPVSGSGSLNNSANGGGSDNSSFIETGGSEFGSRLNPTNTPAVRAQQQSNRSLLLAKGTNIPCVLETKIVTTQPGFTRCQISRDVYSADGKTLLLERGSKIIGEQTAALVQGQARVFVLWNEAETPNGIRINLASPGAGALGEGGHAAKVDYHFWQRFGGALLISLISDLADNLSQRQGISGSNNSITYENSTDAAEEMATEALKNSINIPPTGTINQGSLINIMTARDVDFSSVYERVPFPYF